MVKASSSWSRAMLPSQHQLGVDEPTWCLQAVGRVDPDGSRYLLGDSLGNLHMLVLSHDSQRVVGLKLEALGRISAPSTLSYLDSGVVFVVCRLAQMMVSLIRAMPARSKLNPVLIPHAMIDALTSHLAVDCVWMCAVSASAACEDVWCVDV